MQRRAAALMRRYASYVMSSMRTALRGTLHPRWSPIERPDLPAPQTLCAADKHRASNTKLYRVVRPPRRLRNCISRIIGVSPAISILHSTPCAEFEAIGGNVETEASRTTVFRQTRIPLVIGANLEKVSVPCQLGKNGSYRRLVLSMAR